MLGLLRFLVIEPTGQRALNNAELVNKILSDGVTKTGKNSITISIGSALLDSTKSTEDDFSTQDMILMISSAMDLEKPYKKQNSAEKLERKLNGILASVSESKDPKVGFCFDYYIPYFQEMKEKGYLETFSYIAMASANDKKVNKWLKAHSTEINNFYKWNKAYKFVED